MIHPLKNVIVAQILDAVAGREQGLPAVNGP
jgi:hypothetical protein